MARYVGGPCNGRTVIDVRPLRRTCGGAEYVRVGLDYYVESAIPATASGGAPVAPSGHRGWADLRRAVNHSVPLALSRGQTLRRAARRTLKRRGRIA